MSIETPVANPDKVETQQETGENGLENGIAGLKVEAQGHVDAQVNGNGIEGVPVPEIELHRACAGGNVEEVRGVLSRGLETLEILGGCRQHARANDRSRYRLYSYRFGYSKWTCRRRTRALDGRSYRSTTRIDCRPKHACPALPSPHVRYPSTIQRYANGT